MPLYEYRCQSCGKVTEVLQRFADPPLAACPQCGGEVKKLFSAPAVQFKGSGWYVTDYAGKGKPAGGSGEGKEEGGKEKKDDKPAASSSSSAGEGAGSGGSGGSKETGSAKPSGGGSSSGGSSSE